MRDDYIIETMSHGDIYISERAPAIAWLDVDTDADDTSTEEADRWCVLRGEAQHRGPLMPWKAWVAIAAAIVEKHGTVPSVMAEHKERRISAGSRMAIERQYDGRWRGVSPRNGTYASCEGTLSEAVTLARGILDRDAEDGEPC